MDELQRLTQRSFLADRFNLFITAWAYILSFMFVFIVVDIIFGDSWPAIVGAVVVFALLCGIRVFFRKRRRSRGIRP